jgi:hypothetical protein
MRRAAPLALLSSLLLLAASECGGGDSGEGAMPLASPVAQPVYESGNLGVVEVPGITVEARARFTLGPDELPLAVIVEGDYVPAAGNEGTAQAELWIYDSLGDQDPANDVLVGAQPMAGPFSRAPLSSALPGTFTVRNSLGAGSGSKVALTGGTWSARLRITGSGWHGVVTSWKLRVITLKGAELRPEPSSFIRD